MTHVPPQWPSRIPCRLALVAEAPADEEVSQGRPLVGPSGRVLNQILRCAGIDRAELFIGNVFDEPAPGNDVMAFTVPIRSGDPDLPPFNGRAFEPIRIRAALERLEGELREARPTVVVPMGAAALWAFTGLSAITQARGAPMLARFVVPGTKIVPTLHPAHVIQKWQMFHVVMADLMRALDEANAGPELRPPRRALWIAPKLADLASFWERHLARADLITVDIETHARQITCVGFAADAEHAIVVPFTDWRQPTRSYWDTAEEEVAAWAWVRDVLTCPTPKLFQNGPYDVWYLWQSMRIQPRNYGDDTRLLHHALYPELPKDLAFLGGTYTREGPWKLLRQDRGDKRYG